MTTKWDLIGKIVEGKKTIESRWYKTRRAPWNVVKEGEWIYFKESGGPVMAKAQVESVLKFEGLTIPMAYEIIVKYGEQILIKDKDVEKWAQGKNYAVLIFLKHPTPIKPFQIDKKGFGNAAAWLTTPSIQAIRII